jgi:hypothetical protein
LERIQEFFGQDFTDAAEDASVFRDMRNKILQMEQAVIVATKALKLFSRVKTGGCISCIFSSVDIRFVAVDSVRGRDAR